MILKMEFDELEPVEEIYIECEFEQRTPEWDFDRLGIPTGTGYSNIITTTGKPSTSAAGYMNQLLADWLAGENVSGYADFFDKNEDIKNGRDHEPEARELYEFITGTKVIEKNFCFKNANKETGVSPDGEVEGQKGGVEIKCVKGKTLVAYKLADKVPTTYFQQMQGQMWVMGWEWCDFFAYHPKVGHFLKRMKRDQVFIDALEIAVANFNTLMKEKRELLSDAK